MMKDYKGWISSMTDIVTVTVLLIGSLLVVGSSIDASNDEPMVTDSPNGITFAVDPVEKATEQLHKCDWKNVIQTKLGSRYSFEAYHTPKHDCVNKGGLGIHGFLKAVHLAYKYHYPLTISPDHIWLLIMQAYATQVNIGKEDKPEDKIELVVKRHNFTKGSPENYWPGVFSNFSSQIREYIGNDTHDLLLPSFSTTTEVERAATEIVLMKTFERRFRYVVLTLCGIPEITLQGTPQDWRLLHKNALRLREDDSSDQWPWITRLEPILDELVSTANGNVNKTFWSGIYKYIDDSGGPYITGWILDLFPFVESSWVYDEDEDEEDQHSKIKGATSDQFPSGITTVPFIWDYSCTIFNMSFYAGFMGVIQDPQSLTISPEIGWIVGDELVTHNHKNNEQLYIFDEDPYKHLRCKANPVKEYDTSSSPSNPEEGTSEELSIQVQSISTGAVTKTI